MPLRRSSPARRAADSWSTCLAHSRDRSGARAKGESCDERQCAGDAGHGAVDRSRATTRAYAKIIDEVNTLPLSDLQRPEEPVPGSPGR
jgi:hypothetical protein